MSETTQEDPQLCLTISEAARILGVSERSAYTYARSGVLPTIRVGGRWIVPRAALLRLLATAEK